MASFLILFLLMAGAAPAVRGHLACVPIIAALVPCFSFLPDEAPSGICCDGVAAVSQQAKAPLGKVIACQCLKDLMRYVPLVTPEKARSIARQCNANAEFVPSTANAPCFNMTWPSSP